MVVVVGGVDVVADVGGVVGVVVSGGCEYRW